MDHARGPSPGPEVGCAIITTETGVSPQTATAEASPDSYPQAVSPAEMSTLPQAVLPGDIPPSQDPSPDFHLKGLGTHRDFFNSSVNNYYIPYHKADPSTYPQAVFNPPGVEARVHNAPVSAGTLPEVHAPQHPSTPESAYPPTSQSSGSPHPQVDGSDHTSFLAAASVPVGTWSSQQSRASTHGSEKQWQQSRPARRRVCGLPAAVFWAIVGVAVALIVAAAVVGGVLGSRAASGGGGGADPDSPYVSGPENGTDGDANSNNNSTANSPAAASAGLQLRADSRLAAVNWTDADGTTTRYGVFGQDSRGGVVLSLWDSDGRRWSTVNVSRAMEEAGSPMAVRAGSPLAVVVSGPPSYAFEMRLYYVSDTGAVEEARCLDESGRAAWGKGDMPRASGSSGRYASGASRLAAVWHRCGGGGQHPMCAGFVYVAYQAEDRSTRVLNSSDWSRPSTLWSGGTAGGGVALTPFRPDPNTSYANELRLHFEYKAGTLAEWKFNATGAWEPGNVISENVPAPSPDFASTSFDSWKQLLVIQTESDGSLTSHVWDTFSWRPNQRVRLLGAPSALKFQSVALNEDGRLFGLEMLSGSNSSASPSIHELRRYDSDPSSFSYVGKIGFGE